MTTNFQIGGVDWDDKFIRRDIFTEGGLWLWGIGASGVLGDNTRTNKSSPVQTVAGGSNWQSCTRSLFHTMAIKTDGTLWAWGGNPSGQLGDGTRTNRSSPVQTIAGGTNWKQVSVAQSSTGAIKTDGSLWMWGFNGAGELATGNLTHRSSPVQTISGGNNWKQLSIGGGVCSAIKTDGTLWTWAGNGYGSLGDGTTISRSSPVQTIAGGNDWKLVSCGFYHVGAIKTDGTLWMWGANYDFSGELGIGINNAPRSSPVQTISGGNNWNKVALGFTTTTAIKTDGTLWVWGVNSDGELGTGNTISYSSPVQTISGGANWKKTAMGFSTAIALKTDGTLWVWGNNTSGTLGDNTIIHRSSPVQTVAGGTNWKAISEASGDLQAVCAIREDFY